MYGATRIHCECTTSCTAILYLDVTILSYNSSDLNCKLITIYKSSAISERKSRACQTQICVSYMVELVGILNITPDSFSDGGQYFDPQTAIAHAAQMIDDVAFIDVGAESTRPGAVVLTDDEEWQRLEPILTILIPKYPGRISLDSYHPATVRRALQIGPVIVNDITAFNNPEMLRIVEDLQPTVIISHHPRMGIQEAHRLQPVSSVDQVRDDLLTKVQLMMDRGLRRDQIILDPGIGFGKTMELNKQLLAFAEQVPDFDVMIGYSRKRFLGEHRMDLEPNLAAGKIAAVSGARYLRVHDVAGHRQLLATHRPATLIQ